MPITIKWMDDHRQILHIQYLGVWSSDDMNKLLDESLVLMAQADVPFVVISDFSQSGSPPRRTLAVAQRGRTMENPHLVARIAIKPGALISTLLRVISKILSNALSRSYIVDSMDEALALANRLIAETETAQHKRQG